MSEAPLGPVTEEEARRWFLKFCWKNNQRFCPRCASRKNYRLGSGRRRCARCRYTFHDFTGRWINNCNLSALGWLGILRLFVSETTARQAAKVLGLSYNTAYKAMSTVRFAILAHALDSRQLIGDDSALGLTLPGRALGQAEAERPVGTPVFGIMDRTQWVFVDLIPGFDIETLLHFKLNFPSATTRSSAAWATTLRPTTSAGATRSPSTRTRMASGATCPAAWPSSTGLLPSVSPCI